jgi:kumamolisin
MVVLQRVAKSCLPIALAIGLITAAGATAEPALAAPTTTKVTVVLKTRHLAQLRQLAHRHGLTHAQRVNAVKRLLPSEAQHRRVAAALRAAGLSVTQHSSWSVSATGTSAEVANAFGTRAVMHAHATPAQRRAAVGPYPTVPASILADAALAYPSGSGPARYNHYVSPGPLNGADYRNAYTSAELTAHGQPPYNSANPNGKLTIATLQFAGWDPNDLTTFAANAGISFDPATDLTMVPVDQPAVPPPSTDDDGYIEVDLDQEALLSTAPFARQRPYFAPNDGSGYLDALAQVLDDVLQTSHAYRGGDPKIVALSASWGLCELDTGRPSMNAMEPILAALLASGVTVFASSGDDGIYDQCSAPGAHVDYPASSPEVIGVGGTTLTPVTTSAPNDGTNWTETGWACTDLADCAAHGGSGGGVSGNSADVGFARPNFQSLLTGAPYGQVSRRLVPDISAAADPATGFRAYTTHPTKGPRTITLGGTSLAAPVSAALFTNALSAHAVEFGAVDVLPALYAAQAVNDGSFRDVTVGSNGATSDAGGLPSVSAGPGYDTVTGLGAPMWPKIVDRVLDPLAWPTAKASLSLSSPSTRSPYRVRATWTGTPAAGGLEVRNAVVRITRVGHSGIVFLQYKAPANSQYTFKATPGDTYQLSVTSYDVAGTTSITDTATLVVPIDDKDLDFFGSWQRSPAAGAFGGSLAHTSHRGAAASVRAKGRTYSLLAHTGPAYGKLVVSQGGRQVKVVNLHASRNGIKKTTFFRGGSVSNRRFDFFCRGSAVNLDAVYVAR